MSYRRSLLRHLAKNPPPTGKVSHAEVRHDDWCALLSGGGPCNCNSDVLTGPLIDRKYGAGQEDKGA